MCQIAKNQNICKEGYEGGLLIYEMGIQEDGQFQRRGEELVGFSETVQEANSMSKISTKRETVTLANHLSRQYWLKISPCSFPFYSSISSELYLIFFKAVKIVRFIWI